MKELAIHNPQLASEFAAGKFTFQEADHAFSAMPLDQAHEQYTEVVKKDGGDIGLMENPQALRRWIV